MAILAAGRPFFTFDVATLTDFVSPLPAKTFDLAGGFLVALPAVLHQYLMNLVRKGNLALFRRGKSKHVGGAGGA